MAQAAVQTRTQTIGSAAGTYVGARSGLAYKLGQEVGAGGNGVVYAVSRRPELVAKIQKQKPTRYDIEKLEALVRGSTPDLLSVAAWPMDCLQSSSGEVVGFVMPRILDARPLYELYSPRSRIQQFPSADFRFLVHAAANIARLFAAVHKAGFICGDVNHSNILVRQTGTVAAVDCDSFQVGDGSRFPCLVGTELFVPPELMGASLGTTRRTTNHDNFGLAVLVFHLLLMGRHPFAGRFLGKGDMPIEQAIAESRYAYSRDSRRTQLGPPPFTPPVETMGAAVLELFERAFAPEARKGGRPSPEAWIDALDALKASLVPCKSVPSHYHQHSAGVCPWCEIEAPARIKLFGGLIKIATATIADLETLWARYLALVEPEPPRALPSLQRRRLWTSQWAARPPLSRLQDGLARFWHWLKWLPGRARQSTYLFLILPLVGSFIDQDLEKHRRVLVSFLSAQLGSAASVTLETLAEPYTALLAVMLLILAGPLAVHLLRLIGPLLSRALLEPPVPFGTPRAGNAPAVPQISRRAAGRAWKTAAAAWQSQSPPPDVSALRPPIEALKKQLDALTAERDARIKACAAPEPEEAQRSRYLGAMRIEDAKLPNIGPARCAVLRSWGIDTAADIEEAKIAEIRGFGKGLTDKLIIWRETRETAFVPNPGAFVDPLEVQKIDRHLATRRTKLMKELRERIAGVETRMKPFHDMRARLWADVEAAVAELAS